MLGTVGWLILEGLTMHGLGSEASYKKEIAILFSVSAKGIEYMLVYNSE